MKVSWDDGIPNIWKNNKCSKPPTSFGIFKIGTILGWLIFHTGWRQLELSRNATVEVSSDCFGSWGVAQIFNEGWRCAPPSCSTFGWHVDVAPVIFLGLYINHSNYRYIYSKPWVLELQTNLANYGAPPCMLMYTLYIAMFCTAELSPSFFEKFSFEHNVFRRCAG